MYTSHRHHLFAMKSSYTPVNYPGFCLQIPVLIAVDDYNVLYSHTDYHEWMSEVYRRQVQPHELRLASALRILEKQVGHMLLLQQRLKALSSA